MMKLVISLKDLQYQEAESEKYYDELEEELDLLLIDAKNHMDNEKDLKRLLVLADKNSREEEKKGQSEKQVIE